MLCKHGLYRLGVLFLTCVGIGKNRFGDVHRDAGINQQCFNSVQTDQMRIVLTREGDGNLEQGFSVIGVVRQTRIVLSAISLILMFKSRKW